MIDPSKIFAAIEASHQLGNQMGETLSKPFLDKAATRDIYSGENASQIVDGVMNACTQMMGQMETVKDSMLNQLAAVQDRQLREKSYDFKPSMGDLRPTDAQGWPRELGDEFFKPFFG